MSDEARSDEARFQRGAKKHLGQHFLHEKGIIAKIVQAVDPRPGDRLVEIGPGQGAITFPLLKRHGSLTAIEFDRDLIAPLTAASKAHGELTIVHSDVLEVDFTALELAGKGIADPSSLFAAVSVCTRMARSEIAA